ncbi:VOC family protein [Pseudaestuariivita sp.]|uniref:VOC family protein n=1 Tax=Pseudaestuariivita sp. TaxID=2211669 RepID=UPI004058573F
MIDHLTIEVSDFAAARAFYDAALAPLGLRWVYEVPPEQAGGVQVGAYGTKLGEFWIAEAAEPVRAMHFAFRAGSRSAVAAFHAKALVAGGTDNGAPGLRPHYHASYYGAFVLDPDGHNVEAVCHKA